MSQIVAQLVITQDDEGLVHVEGSGKMIKNKALACGLLELAKDIILHAEPSRIQPATISDLPH